MVGRSEGLPALRMMAEEIPAGASRRRKEAQEGVAENLAPNSPMYYPLAFPTTAASAVTRPGNASWKPWHASPFCRLYSNVMAVQNSHECPSLLASSRVGRRILLMLVNAALIAFGAALIKAGTDGRKEIESLSQRETSFGGASAPLPW